MSTSESLTLVFAQLLREPLRAVFRETLNACPLEMFVSDDEHGGSFLTSSTPFAGTLREKYTSRACSTGLFRGLVLPQ